MKFPRLSSFIAQRLKRVESATRKAVPALDRGIESYREMPGPKVFVLALSFGLLLLVIWAYFAPIDMVVRGQGRIVPSDHNQIIQHLEGGIVSTLAVREGVAVRKDQVLITIRDVRAASDQGEGQVKLAGLRARVARLTAEANGAQLTLPADVAADPSAQNEQAAFIARQAKLNGELSILREQTTQRQAELNETISRQKSLTDEFNLAQQQYQLVHAMFLKSAASQLEDIQSQARAQDVRSRLNAASAMIPRLRAAISEAQAKVTDGVSRFRAEARADLTTAETELARLSEEMKSRNDRVLRSEVKAPMDGVVNRIFVNTVGGVVKPGDPILEMTPIDDKVVVEANINPTDRAELAIGKPARVKVTAYDYGVFGSMQGKVTEISADTVPEERGERHYRVKIEVSRDPEQIKSASDGLPLMPGMTATADIVVGRRTVWQYLMSPINRFTQSALREPR
ncbi:HlyD family type I secretion periplasmic adaptor subunit [Herminiimonas sp. KBW02]|uniref:HlyD family type I secretion periplasmic adaptor subunit n=1 Tax=Herminiimonas sp. KBW02 TaxID=2153363 RepID=UPI000F58FAD5|nr:HlyD family type I secretion periplasmic adaptor subunit [Herminiimonas sp. KBW02]RQO33314.1 HlyD family type I secretion periplasmic adaptor subunit [Herminiimonas sp. KBW02]